MAATLDKNNDMIWQLCCSVDEALSNHTPPPTSEPQPASKVKLPQEKSYSSDVESRKDAKNASLERAASSHTETRYGCVLYVPQLWCLMNL
jgi:hypothetical protein